MGKTRQLYIMISRTDTTVAKIIRSVCRYPYNHVSLTLDPSLRSWYSFARYVQDTPFYSGFVHECVERFLVTEETPLVRIFRVDIPEKHALALEKFFRTAGQPENGLIYNMYDALLSCMGLQLPIPKAYTCLSFACTVLGQQHTSIESLSNALAPNLIFEGDLSQLVSDSGRRDDPYFDQLGFAAGTAKSTLQMSKLTTRLMRYGLTGYRAHRVAR